MPIQFRGIIEEHRAVRSRAGLFDVSHMGEVEIRGRGASALLQRVLTHDVERLRPGRALYSPVCLPSGGMVDDLLVYRLAEEAFLLIPNAANVNHVLRHVERIAEEIDAKDRDDVTIQDRSDEYALLALQGPRAASILMRIWEGDAERDPVPSALRPFQFLTDVPLAGRRTRIVSRTGYTGEDGFEIFLAPDDAASVWRSLMEVGESQGLQPAGLGARDTLRLEAALPLYGNELTEETNPIEAGLERFVKLDKGDFVGRDALLRIVSAGISRRLVGLEVEERGIPRQGYRVTDGRGKEIGTVTSGTHAPWLERSIALAYLASDWTQPGTQVAVVIRGRERRARVVSTPFYRRREGGKAGEEPWQ